MATEFIDDKSPICIPWILATFFHHQRIHPGEPFFIGLNGVQGAGKTTLVSALSAILRAPLDRGGADRETLVFSIDDLYLRHEDQVKLATENAENPLVQHRGEPGTHDMVLARELFTALKTQQQAQIPQYDKSAFSGRGDRVIRSQWTTVNGPSQPKVEVIIFEGWSVGFRALLDSEVASKQSAALSDPKSTLPKHRLEDLLFVNEKLRAYDVMTDALDAFIHIDAEETGYVYDWRLQQEAALRREKGTGMSDEEVRAFVDGYYPAYELFTERLRSGIFEKPGRQLRLVVGKDRKVKQKFEM